MKKPSISKNIMQELEIEKRKCNSIGDYKKAKEIQDKLDFYYFGINAPPPNKNHHL